MKNRSRPFCFVIFFFISLGFLFNPVSTVRAQTAAETESFDSDFEFMEEEFGAAPIAVSDPLAPVNRVMFRFNDKLYFWVLKPAAQGYRAVIPGFARTGIRNFFHNLRAPIRIAGALLQLKGEKAMIEYSRFLVNSTAGGLGFFNVLKKYPHLNPSAEDSGQTLAHYGIGNGFYIVWPVIGPSSLRDTFGLMADGLYLDPLSYVEPTEAYYGIRSMEVVNDTSLRIGDYESLKQSALEPYEAFRDAYIQYRNELIRK